MSAHPPTIPDAVPSAGHRLLTDAMVNYSGLLVGMVVGILLVPFMLGRLGIAQYGVWIAALVLAATLRGIDFGLGLVISREVAAHANVGEHGSVALLVSAAGGVLLVLGGVGAALMLVGALALAAPLDLPPGLEALVLPVFALIALASLAEQALAFVTAVLTGLRRFVALNLLTIVATLLRAIAIVGVLLAEGSLVSVAAWYAAASVIAAGVAFMTLRRHGDGLGIGLPGRHWALLREHYAFGLASFVSTLTAGMVWQALPLIAAALLGASAVVVVHIGQRIPIAMTGLYGRIAAVVFPSASAYQRSADVAGTRSILVTGTRLVLHLVIPLTVVGLVATNTLLDAWLGQADPEIALMLRLTLAAVAADALGAVAINLLWGRGMVAPALIASGASLMVVVGGSVVLLPWVGVVAGAWLLVAVHALSSAWFWLLACRAAQVGALTALGDTLRGIVLPTLACVAIVASVAWATNLPSITHLLVATIAGGFAYLVILLWSGSNADERGIALALGRVIGARSTTLRSLGYLLLSAAPRLSARSRPNDAEFDGPFAARQDPWGYDDPAHTARIDAALAALDALPARAAGGRFAHAVELGCAEGQVTVALAARCCELMAVDPSRIALGRCRTRCAGLTGVAHQRADIEGAGRWGPYDLVVAMDVLDCIGAPSALRRARDAVVAMLADDGHLVVSTTHQHRVAEDAWWGRWLPVGAAINRFVGQHPRLRVVGETMTSTHLITVYRKPA